MNATEPFSSLGAEPNRCSISRNGIEAVVRGWEGGRTVGMRVMMCMWEEREGVGKWVSKRVRVQPGGSEQNINQFHFFLPERGGVESHVLPGWLIGLEIRIVGVPSFIRLNHDSWPAPCRIGRFGTTPGMRTSKVSR